MMEDDSSADDLLIDVDEEDFALTAEEMEQAEEMLGSNIGVGIGVEMKEKGKEMLKSTKSEIEDQAKGGTEVQPETRNNNVEAKVGQTIKVQTGPVPKLGATSLLHQSQGTAVTEKKASTEEVAAKEAFKMGGSKFTVKKVSTRPAGQQQ